jgi:hypothetical protein
MLWNNIKLFSINISSNQSSLFQIICDYINALGIIRASFTVPDLEWNIVVCLTVLMLSPSCLVAV